MTPIHIYAIMILRGDLMKKDEICTNNWIERSNVLNEMRTPLNLTEMRLLLVYQSKINARNIDTIRVTFTLESFQKIMDINNVDISALKRNMKKISQRSVEIPYKKGFQFVPLYQRCGMYQNSNGEWCIDLECNQEILPYMFEMKKNYFKYQLWNSIKLTSLNQIRMYEILKQYEKIGKRKILVEELKPMLGISTKQYTQYRDFKRYVLDVCQKALEANTDIKYTYETLKGAKGKVLSIVFTITKNENFKDDLKLKEFIKQEDLDDIRDYLPPEMPILKEVPAVQEAPAVQEYQEPPQPPKTKPKSQDKDISRMVVRDETVKLYHDLEGVYSVDELINLVHIAEGITAKPEAYIRAVYYQILARGNKVNNMYKYTLGVILSDLKSGKFGSTYAEEEESSDRMPQATVDYYQRCLIENDVDLTKW